MFTFRRKKLSVETVGLTRQRIQVSCFKCIQTNKMNYVQRIKWKIENNVMPSKEYK